MRDWLQAHVFTDVSELASQPGYLGCPFVNVAAEFQGPSHAARQFVQRNKALQLARLRDHAQAAGVADPDAPADNLAFLSRAPLPPARPPAPTHRA